MANGLYRYLPLGLGEDGQRDHESQTTRFGWRRWSLSRIVGLVVAAFVALLFLFHSFKDVCVSYLIVSRH
jgi:hypothetical protein